MCYYSLKSSPKYTKPKNIEGHKNLLGLVIYQKYVTVGSFRENCVTHARTAVHKQMVQSNRRTGDNYFHISHVYVFFLILSE